MRTKELKNNKTMRTGVILAAIAIITLIALIMTFAKYASQGTGEDSARVAKWGLGSDIPTDLNLFDASYLGTDSKVTVDSSDHAKVIAPGTSKSTNITLATFTNKQAPEVMYHFEPSLTITNEGGGTELINKLDNLPGWKWTLGVNNSGTVKEYETVAQVVEAVGALQEPDISPNTMPNTSSIQLGWKWAFDDDGKETYDTVDTELGNLIAQGNLSSIKVTLNLKAYQCQGCSPTPTYKPIQSTVGTETVTFLPAFETGKAPAKFYRLDTNGYTELDNTSMATLGKAISDAGPANVYTDAIGATFYGVTIKTWDDAFDKETKSGDALGLNSDFKDVLDNTPGVKTVYGDYVDGKWVKDSTGNWDSDDTAVKAKTCPTINGINYGTSLDDTKEFYGAYSSLLPTLAYYAYSSRANTERYAYCWTLFDVKWNNGDQRYSNKRAIVLTKTF